ncbi:MAG: hypothetical protein NTZ33_10670 [Bacteroidetes bacterium]|nr:hypothetical protein [Bacteroidota bacterium]
MKIKSYIFSILLIHTLFLIFLSDKSLAQVSSQEICFVKLTENIGYIIDTAENNECNCIPYVDKKNFSCAALILLSDNKFLLRVMLVDSLGFRDINIEKNDVLQLFYSASTIKNNIALIDDKLEEDLLKMMTGEAQAYKLIDFEELSEEYHIESVKKTSLQHNFNFVNLGFGIAASQHQSYYSLGLEIGLAD